MNRQPLKAAAAAALVAGGVLLTAAPARAQMKVDDTGTQLLITALQTALSNVINNMGARITSAVTTMETSVNQLLTNGFTQQANYTKAAVGAQQQIADASNMVNARIQRDFRNASIRDEHTVNPQICNAANGGQSPIVASIASYNVANAIQEVSDNRGEAGPGMPAYRGQAQAVQAINRLHYARYCSANEAQAGLCTLSQIPNADQQARALFGSGTYEEQVGVDSANDFKTNLLQPIVPAALRADQLKSLVGQDEAVRRRRYNARMSLAGNAVSYAIAVQTPSVPLSAQQKAQLVAERLPSRDTGSWLTALSLEVNRRLSDAGWHASLAAMPPASVQREIASQLALANYLKLQAFRVAMTGNTLMATLVAQNEEQGFREAVPMPSPDMASN